MIVVSDTSPICYLLLINQIEILLEADLVILDDKAARQIAVERGLKIVGLLGIIKDAARSGLLDLGRTFEQFQEVGFWVAPSILERLLTED